MASSDHPKLLALLPPLAKAPPQLKSSLGAPSGALKPGRAPESTLGREMPGRPSGHI